jgi:hypothetical protein
LRREPANCRAPSVKQRLAALRHLFDWLVNGQIVPVNPAHTVRGPRRVVTIGQTPPGLEAADIRGALIAECFTPRLRYSGASIGYQLASVVAGGPAPLIATALLAATGSGYVIAAYIAFCALVSIIATILLPDYTNRNISQEHA